MAFSPACRAVSGPCNPVVLGVPASTPVEELIVMPVGSACADHVRVLKGAAPTATAALPPLYALATVPATRTLAGPEMRSVLTVAGMMFILNGM